MRKIREVLRLKFEVGLSTLQVAISLQVGRASVGEYFNRFAASDLAWPSALTDAELQRHLFPTPPAVPSDQHPVHRLPQSAWFGQAPDPATRQRPVAARRSQPDHRRP